MRLRLSPEAPIFFSVVAAIVAMPGCCNSPHSSGLAGLTVNNGGGFCISPCTSDVYGSRGVPVRP